MVTRRRWKGGSKSEQWGDTRRNRKKETPEIQPPFVGGNNQYGATVANDGLRIVPGKIGECMGKTLTKKQVT